MANNLLILSIFLTGLVTSVPSVWSFTESDVKACRQFLFGRVKCNSLNFLYRECIVPGATYIDAIKLGHNFTQERCDFEKHFGFRGNAVWVTDGCNGEFYVCYDGVYIATTPDGPASTARPPFTVTLKPTSRPGPTQPRQTTPIDVQRGSVLEPASDNLYIYIIVGVAIVVLVGLGVLLGCYVKRRQQRDKSRHLAEKRQMRIEKKQQREFEEDQPTYTLPMATRSLSMESVRTYDYSNKTGNRFSLSSRAGSECSSRSSNTSGITSVSRQKPVSNMTNGNTDRSRRSLKRYSTSSVATSNQYGRLRKGVSTPDIRTIGRYGFDQNSSSFSKKSRSIAGSVTSLESVREVCDKYRVYNIPLEKKMEDAYKRPAKYNTVGFSGGSCQERTIKSGVSTLPINRVYTRASIHSPRSSVNHNNNSPIYQPSRSKLDKDYNSSSPRSNQDNSPMSYLTRSQLTDNPRSINQLTRQSESPFESHYQEPDYFLPKLNTSLVQTGSVFRPVKPPIRGSVISSSDTVYAQPNKQRHKHAKQASPAVYASVTKSSFKTSPSPESLTGVLNVSFAMDENEDRNDTPEEDRHYGHMGTFRPVENKSTSPLSLKFIEKDNSVDTFQSEYRNNQHYETFNPIDRNTDQTILEPIHENGHHFGTFKPAGKKYNDTSSGYMAMTSFQASKC